MNLMITYPFEPHAITGELHDLALVRREVYSFCLRALEKPSLDQFTWMRSRAFWDTLDELFSEFDVRLSPAADLPGEYSLFESFYLACFEVGLPNPPVPLLASHYNKREPVPATIHEHVLFYKRFGVRLAPGNIEPADHLCNELTFLIRLDELLAEGTVPADSILHARSDFLTRHPARWLPQAHKAAEEMCLPELYVALIDLLGRAVAQDLDLTQAECSS